MPDVIIDYSRTVDTVTSHNTLAPVSYNPAETY